MTQLHVAGVFRAALRNPFFRFALSFTLGLLCSFSSRELLTELMGIAPSKQVAQILFVVFNDWKKKKKKKGKN